jgi:hypothetical protein
LIDYSGFQERLDLFKLEDTGNAKLAVVIFFTTLREVLLNQLLFDLMLVQKIPDKISGLLFSDNLAHKQRLDKLFPSLTGVKWKSAIREINKYFLKDVEVPDKLAFINMLVSIAGYVLLLITVYLKYIK